MRKQKGRLLHSLVAAGLLLLLPSFSAADGVIHRNPANGQTETRQSRAAELAALRQRIALLRDDLNRVHSRYDALRNDLRVSEEAIGRIAGTLHDLNIQLALQRRKLAALQRKRADLENSIARQRRLLGEQIRAAYAMGRQEYLKILLSQQQPATLGRVITYYDYLNRARSARISSLLEAMRQLDRVRRQIETETDRLAALRDQQRQQKADLELNQAARTRLMSRLKHDMRSKSQRLQQMLSDEKELESLVNSLAQALADIPAEPGNQRPFAQMKGRLSWPLRGPIIDRYGARRVGNLRWQGVLIAAKAGQPVRAISYGRVAFADWLRGYGMLLIIDHGNGYMSLYGHNQTLYKSVGDWVAAGDVIAAAGTSGGDSTNALYFEIRRNGKPTNPSNWCRR